MHIPILWPQMIRYIGPYWTMVCIFRFVLPSFITIMNHSCYCYCFCCFPAFLGFSLASTSNFAQEKFEQTVEKRREMFDKKLDIVDKILAAHVKSTGKAMEQTRDAQKAQDPPNVQVADDIEDADHPDHTVDAEAMPKSKACPLFGLRICEVKVVNLWKSMKRQACNTASHGRLRKRQAIPMDIDHFPAITSEWVSIGCLRWSQMIDGFACW